MRADALREALAGSTGADDRLRAGGQRQHGRLRSGRRDRRRVRGRRRLAPRRRRVRALGRRQPTLPAPHRGLRARRLLGDRRAQVAERPVRLRRRLLPASGVARRRRWPSPRAISSAPTAAARPTGCPSRRAARAASPSGPRCARSAATASPSSSSAAATTRARFAELLGAEPGVEILNDVVLNQVLVRFGDDDETTREVVRRVQADGTCWLGGTDWHGRAAMRISVSSFRTTRGGRRARARRAILERTDRRRRALARLIVAALARCSVLASCVAGESGEAGLERTSRTRRRPPTRPDRSPRTSPSGTTVLAGSEPRARPQAWRTSDQHFAQARVGTRARPAERAGRPSRATCRSTETASSQQSPERGRRHSQLGHVPVTGAKENAVEDVAALALGLDRHCAMPAGPADERRSRRLRRALVGRARL